MVTEEKFNEIYQKIVKENADDMEMAREEARVEKRHNMYILIVIILITIALSYGIYKLTGDFIVELENVLIIISWFIYMKVKNRGGKSKIYKYTIDFKTKVVGKMIKSFEEQLEIKPQYRIAFNSI